MSWNNVSFEVKLVRSWNFQVSFEIAGWDIPHDFVYFSDLDQLAASFLATNILFSYLSPDASREIVGTFDKILPISLT